MESECKIVDTDLDERYRVDSGTVIQCEGEPIARSAKEGSAGDIGSNTEVLNASEVSSDCASRDASRAGRHLPQLGQKPHAPCACLHVAQEGGGSDSLVRKEFALRLELEARIQRQLPHAFSFFLCFLLVVLCLME